MMMMMLLGRRGRGGGSVVRSGGGDVKVEDVNRSQDGDNIYGRAEHLAACVCVRGQSVFVPLSLVKSG